MLHGDKNQGEKINPKTNFFDGYKSMQAKLVKTLKMLWLRLYWSRQSDTVLLGFGGLRGWTRRYIRQLHVPPLHAGFAHLAGIPRNGVARMQEAQILVDGQAAKVAHAVFVLRRQRWWQKILFANIRVSST